MKRNWILSLCFLAGLPVVAHCSGEFILDNSNSNTNTTYNGDDARTLNLIKTSVTVETRGTDTYNSITQDVGLITSGPNGATIRWSSDKPDVISSTGKVTRPTTGGDVKVTLTATFTVGKLSDSNRYNLTVLTLADREKPVPGARGTLKCAEKKSDQFTVQWTVASDDMSSPEALQYRVYVSEKQNVDNAENAVANGTAAGEFEAGILQKVVTSLQPETTYYVNVVVKDEAGQQAAYRMTSCKTEEGPDTEAPRPGNDGALGFSNVGWDTVEVDWESASDNQSKMAQLEYRLYFSASDNIKTLGDVEANGTPVGNFSNKSRKSVPIQTLKPSTPYYFNVVVKDQAGNKAVYKSKAQTTKEQGVLAYTVSGYDTNGRKVNGTYTYSGFESDRPSYVGPGKQAVLTYTDLVNPNVWVVLFVGAVKFDYFHPSSTGDTPPLTGWHKEAPAKDGTSILAPKFLLVPQKN